MHSVDNLLRDYSGDVPGASVLVVRDGKVVIRKSYGMANLEERIAATPDTNYRLASVTKQFTAASILILAKNGKLSLDDPITKYLALPAYANAITIRHLLTHTSGLFAYEDLIPPGTTRQLKDADVLAILKDDDGSYFPAGTQYRYSNTGYAFLALIVERASGQRFADFLRDNIFKPAGMNATVAFEEGVSTVARRAYGYSRADGAWHRTDQSLTSAVLGDGGIYTSIDDLVHWIAWLESGRFDDALVPAIATDDPAVRYGFGWRISEHGGHRIVWHTGETIGFRNAIVRVPDRHLAVVVLTNRNEREPYRIAIEIVDMLLKERRLPAGR
ncbi:MAG: beta-lactamase family protein [Acidobacteriota bacterium]|nr:beta-lactamase family protein [Acidobacteriota bacterium]